MSDFKWRHFQGTMILACVRWYCKYGMSYRELEEMMLERGMTVDHTTILPLGFSTTRLRWRNGCGGTGSRPAAIAGVLMRPISGSKASGCICTEPLISAGIRLIFISLLGAIPRRLNGF